MRTLFVLTSLLSIFLLGAKPIERRDSKREEQSSIRVVPVRPTPEPDNVVNRLIFPKEGQLIYQQPLTVQLQLLGFPVGTISEFSRRKQIYNDPNGQSMLIFIDNQHPIEIYNTFVDALNPNNLFYDITLATQIPYDLEEGMHIIRAFPDRSYGESLKGPNCYVAAAFYIGSRSPKMAIDLNAPYMTYNEPLETITYTEGKPILLDFYLSNVQLSRDGFRMLLTIDGKVKRILTQWIPYYIYGLERGQHTVQLQLIDRNQRVISGSFNDVTRTITID